MSAKVETSTRQTQVSGARQLQDSLNEEEERLCGRCEDLLREERVGEVIDLCTTWKTKQPRSPHGWTFAARAYLLRGENGPAEENLTNALALVSPRSETSQKIVQDLTRLKSMTTYRSKCLQDLGKKGMEAQVLSQAQKAVDISPLNGHLQIMKASAQLAAMSAVHEPTIAQEMELALTQSLDRAVELVDANTLIHVTRAACQYSRVLHRNGLTQEADCLLDEVCTRCAAASFGSASPHTKTCTDLLRLYRMMESAKADANEAYSKGNYQHAVKLFSDALLLDPSNDLFNAVIASNRAAAYMGLGDYTSAFEDCDQALQMVPTFVRARVRRARCSIKLGRFRDGIEDFEVALRATPSASLATELAEAKKLYKESRSPSSDEQKHYQDHSSSGNRTPPRRQEFQRQPHQTSPSTPWRKPESAPSMFANSPRMSPGVQSPYSSPSSSSGSKSYSSRTASPLKPPKDDWYRILGITPNASNADVKRAYYRLALIHHPDKNPGDDQAAQRFKKIVEAFSVLSDPIKRRKYDCANSTVYAPMI